MQLLKFALPFMLTVYGGIVTAQTSQPKAIAVVELFTSEGCSSCPPAEATLAQIKAAYPQNVLVLEYHVDYWNHLGWKDAYSSHDYTLRQQQYARQFHLDGSYTPQAVVNGNSEMVGSDKQKITTTINHVLSAKAANKINIVAHPQGNNIEVDYTASLAGEVLNIVLVQKSTATNVKGGENGGRHLAHTNVVRQLRIIDTEKTTGKTTVTLPAGLTAKDCSIIAYTQQKSNWTVTGAVEYGL